MAKFTHYLSRYGVAILAAILLSTCLYQLWLFWPSLVVSSIQWQREVNAQLAELLYDAQTSPLVAGGYLIGFSFLYGMLHSLGPGHGKVIVTTYLATHPTAVKTSLIMTVISAIFQALVAIALVSILIWGFSASMRVVNQQAMVFVSLSFALVSTLGGLVCWKAIKQIYNATRSPQMKIVSLAPLAVRSSTENEQAAIKPAVYSPALYPTSRLGLVKKQHPHGEDCGCGHQHVASAEAVNNASTWREYVSIVATIGIRPCTGAIMVLLFSNIAGLYWMGVVSAIAMAIGTALTTSFIALMTLTSKHFIKHYLLVGKSTDTIGWKLTSYLVQLLGGLFLIIVGLVLLIGQQDYGISPLL